MRILMISEHASPLSVLGGVDSGGQNVYVAKLSEQLAHRGLEIDIVTRRESESTASIVVLSPHVRLIHIPAGPPVYIPKEKLLPFMGEFSEHCAQLARARKYDVVHANFFMSGLVGLHLRQKLGVPLVVTFHALGKVRRLHQKEADGFPNARFDIEDQIVQHADAIIAECPQDREDLLKLYNADPRKLRVIPCGYDPLELQEMTKESARRWLGDSSSTFIALQLGRLVPRKGVDTAIRGFARFIKETSAEATLYIVGGSHDIPAPAECPELARLMQLAAAEGLGTRIVFTGRKKRHELQYYYSAANAFISTPWYEPFGITAIEAMACGTAVIGSNVGGIKSTVLDGETGYLVPPNNPETVAERLKTLYVDPSLARTLGQRGRERAARFYTWATIASDILELYHSARPLPNTRRRQRNLSRGLFSAHESLTTSLPPLEGSRQQGAV